MIELRELDTARAILRQTQVMGVMKQEEPERYLRMEHLLVRSYFDPHEVWELYCCLTIIKCHIDCFLCGCYCHISIVVSYYSAL